MIGGGGSACGRADHGIGIRETDAASYVHKIVVKLNLTLVMTPIHMVIHPSPTR